jgi:alcohol dehydrogenase
MPDVLPSFSHDYDCGKILYGRGCVAQLNEELSRLGYQRALVVCGTNVGANQDVMEPVVDGLGNTLVEIFDETSPDKYIETAYNGVEMAKEHGVDVLVAVGSGSSVDTAKVISALLADRRDVAELRAEAEANSRISVPDEPILPIVAVPTTLSGADLSFAGGVKFVKGPVPPGEGHAGSVVVDPRLMPEAVFYDPDVVETTPTHILGSSLMNGFDKGIEMLYSPNADPITDATASHGLEILGSSLHEFADGPPPEAVEGAITGTILVQYGVSDRNVKKLSIIHSFGHAFSRHTPAQQGSVHGIIAPHVLDYVFDEVPGRRDMIAASLGVDTDSPERAAAGVVEEVASIRDSLGLPSQLRELRGVNRGELPVYADVIMSDRLMEYVPEGLDPTRESILGVLESAW